MKIHEYQAKELLRKHNVPVPNGILIDDKSKAANAAKTIGTNITVIKAQIHAGGRGKGGGVKLAKNSAEAETHAEKILGMNLVTPQTGPKGKLVKKVLIEEGMEIAQELYLSIVIDREISRPLIIASAAGGMEIEEVAQANPEKIVKEPIDPIEGVQPYLARKICFALGLSKEVMKSTIPFIISLYKAFQAEDCDMLEINPLVVTNDNRVLALDAKINIDDNALGRHPTTINYRDLDEEDPTEIEAGKFNLNFIKLDGNIGCMVNGAGLAMATMDIIKHSGGKPANFLDVGGGASPDKVCEAMKIILSDNDVEKILVNIFGGILRCDLVATGIIKAFQSVENKNIPLIVRMAGTNADQGISILKRSELKVIFVQNLDDASIAIREN